MSPPESPAPSKSEILGEVRSALQAEFGIPSEDVQLATHLVDDLDLDSIDAVDLAARMEEGLGFTLREEELKSIRTVEDVVELVHAGLLERAGSH